MPLILTLSSLRGGTAPESRTLSEGTISIGRGSSSDWVLADPERLLSKMHCMIGPEGSRYVLTDLSTNGVFINGAREPTARDSRVFLTDGDSFRLGDYTVNVTEVERVPGPGPASAPAPWSHAGGAEDPFASGGDDPFGGEPGTMFRHPIPPRPVPAARTDDPFAPPHGSGSNARAPGVGRFDVDDDLFQGTAPDPSWKGEAQADNADAARHSFAAPKSFAPVSFDDLDLDALLGDEPPGAPPPAPRPREATAPVPAMAAAPAARAAASSTGPRPAPPPDAQPSGPAPPVPSTPAAPAASAPPADAGVLLAAFLEGAGVAGLNVGQDPQAMMQAAGAVFRAMAEGLREVLMSRAAIKNELRVEQTMLRARDNNALKFSVTPEEAVAALLMPRPGYLSPVAAAREACRDIQSHEMAVMAGVQTALVGLLRRFDPAALETRLQPGRLDGLLPASRKARVWELFCATYTDIAREAEDDFQSVFGREFARAYDAQMRKM